MDDSNNNIVALNPLPDNAAQLVITVSCRGFACLYLVMVLRRDAPDPLPAARARVMRSPPVCIVVHRVRVLLIHLCMQIHSPEELDAQLSEAGSKLTVLCCKARSCRPCKV